MRASARTLAALACDDLQTRTATSHCWYDDPGVGETDRINLEKTCLAGLDDVALVHPDGVEVARHAGGDIGGALGLERALYGEPALEDAVGHHLRTDGQGGFLRFDLINGSLCLGAVAAERQPGQRQKREC